MRRRVDVEGLGELPVPLQTQTLVVALETRFSGRRWVELRGLASNLLLAVLAGAGDEGLGLARLVLLAVIRGMALVDARMVARFPRLAAWLGATRSGDAGIFTLSRLVARLLALVSPALELLPARQAAPPLLEPTGLVLERFLAANAGLLHQVGTGRAGRIIGVALVLDRRMATRTGSGAGEPALGRPRPAWLRRLEDRPSAGAADLVEDGLRARHAGPFVAELLAGVLAALELTAAYLQANMLRLEVVVGSPLLLPPLGRLLLARATALSALVPPAVELSPAGAEAVRVLDFPLVAGRVGHCPSAPARNVHGLGARRAGASVAFVRAQMTASQNLIAWLVAVRNGVLTRPSWLEGHRVEGRLATRAVGDNIRREGAVSGHFILRVAGIPTGMVSAVECPATHIAAAERALEPLVRAGFWVF